jgi:cobalamin biosynthesis protein CobW
VANASGAHGLPVLVPYARHLAKGHPMKTLAKLPVTIVTGFLGSGKTTLLRHMLDNAQGRRIAVIVNEFGELGIDGEILKQCSIGCTEEEANGRVYELANGCLCCTVQEEFFPVMRELVARRGDLDHILIETSGLALPKPWSRPSSGRKSATPAPLTR